MLLDLGWGHFVNPDEILWMAPFPYKTAVNGRRQAIADGTLLNMQGHRQRRLTLIRLKSGESIACSVDSEVLYRRIHRE